jgi:hypothetical protein
VNEIVQKTNLQYKAKNIMREVKNGVKDEKEERKRGQRVVVVEGV